MTKPTAAVYVDGFNLYKRALEKTDFKWLNIGAMFDLLLKKYKVEKIMYFTALIKSPPHDLQRASRQQIYFRALKLDSRVEIVQSTFQDKNSFLPVIPWEYDKEGHPIKTKVKNYKEKGSDVNLATHLIFDGLSNRYDSQFVLTADSDLVTPIVKLKECGKSVGLILPNEVDSKEIKLVSEPLIYRIRKNLLLTSQYPDKLEDSEGEFSKPTSWRKTETPT